MQNKTSAVVLYHARVRRWVGGCVGGWMNAWMDGRMAMHAWMHGRALAKAAVPHRTCFGQYSITRNVRVMTSHGCSHRPKKVAMYGCRTCIMMEASKSSRLRTTTTHTPNSGNSLSRNCCCSRKPLQLAPRSNRYHTARSGKKKCDERATYI